MSKAINLLNMLEATLDPEVQKVIDQLDAAFKKIIPQGTDRTYKMVNKDGVDYALFSIPVITMERGRATDKESGDATNSTKNFRTIFNQIWGLRDKGYFISQPVGSKGWEDKDKGVSGTTMQFYFGKKQGD